MTMFYALVALCLSGSALAQVPAPGGCPLVNGQANFEISGLMGKWYEAARFFHMFELRTKCNIVVFSPGTNSTLYVKNSFISGITGDPGYVDADIHVPDPEYPSKMLVKGLPLSRFGANSDYWILGTDYNNYAVVYACTDYDYFNVKYAWLLTRERNPKQSVLDKAYEVVHKNKVKASNFWKTEQKKCWEGPIE